MILSAKFCGKVRERGREEGRQEGRERDMRRMKGGPRRGESDQENEKGKLQSWRKLSRCQHVGFEMVHRHKWLVSCEAHNIPCCVEPYAQADFKAWPHGAGHRVELLGLGFRFRVT